MDTYSYAPAAPTTLPTSWIYPPTRGQILPTLIWLIFQQLSNGLQTHLYSNAPKLMNMGEPPLIAMLN